MQRIILDTNFLVDVFKFKINLKEELDRIMLSSYELCTLDKVIDELKKLAGKNIYAKIALEFSRNLKIVKTNEGSVDDLLVDLQDDDTIIATDDKVLKSRLECKKIIIREKKYLKIMH